MNIKVKIFKSFFFYNTLPYLDFIKFGTSEKYDIVIYSYAEALRFIYIISMKSNTTRVKLVTLTH